MERVLMDDRSLLYDICATVIHQLENCIRKSCPLDLLPGPCPRLPRPCAGLPAAVSFDKGSQFSPWFKWAEAHFRTFPSPKNRPTLSPARLPDCQTARDWLNSPTLRSNTARCPTVTSSNNHLSPSCAHLL